MFGDGILEDFVKAGSENKANLFLTVKKYILE